MKVHQKNKYFGVAKVCKYRALGGCGVSTKEMYSDKGEVQLKQYSYILLNYITFFI